MNIHLRMVGRPETAQGEQSPTGQSHSRAEQAHTLGLNDSSAQRGGASTPARHAEQARMQEPNESSAQIGGARTPDSTAGSDEPGNAHRLPTYKSVSCVKHVVEIYSGIQRMTQLSLLR